MDESTKSSKRGEIMIKKTITTAGRTSKAVVLLDKVTSQMYIVANCLGTSPADDKSLMWNVAEEKCLEVCSSVSTLLKNGCYCAVYKGEASMSVAERTLGQIEDKMADLEDEIGKLDAIKSVCKEFLAEPVEG